MLYNEIFKHERKGSKSFVKLDTDKDINIINYQVNMIKENTIKGVLPINISKFNNIETLCYDITSKIPLERYLNICSNREKIFKLIIDICEILNDSYKYYLDENQFLIDTDFIYIDPEGPEVYLLYLPFKTKLNSLNSLIDICVDLNKYNFEADILYRELINKKEIKFIDIINIINSIIKEKKDNNNKEVVVENTYIEKKDKSKQFFKSLINKILSSKNTNSNRNIFFEFKPDSIDYNSAENIKEAYFNVSEKKAEIEYEQTVLLNNMEASIEIENVKHIINKESYIIGRMKKNTDLCINNQSVGKIHCGITKKENNYYITDFNTKNGTIINGKRIISGKEYLLKHNDILYLADLRCRFNYFSI